MLWAWLEFVECKKFNEQGNTLKHAPAIFTSSKMLSDYVLSIEYLFTDEFSVFQHQNLINLFLSLSVNNKLHHLHMHTLCACFFILQLSIKHEASGKNNYVIFFLFWNNLSRNSKLIGTPRLVRAHLISSCLWTFDFISKLHSYANNSITIFHVSLMWNLW